MILDKARFEAQLACREYEWHMLIKVNSRAQGERLGVSDMCFFFFFKNPFQTAHAEQLIIRWQQVTCWHDEKMLIIQMCPQPFCFNGFISMKCKSWKRLSGFLSCMPVCEVLVCTFGWYVCLSVWLPFVLFFSWVSIFTITAEVPTTSISSKYIKILKTICESPPKAGLASDWTFFHGWWHIPVHTDWSGEAEGGWHSLFSTQLVETTLHNTTYLLSR